MVVDTSAWVEYLRATGSRSDRLLTDAIRKGHEVLVPDVVRLELLAGAADEPAAHDLRRLLARCTAVPAASPADHDAAASSYRAARRSGRTVRSLVDCLVAAVALRVDAPVLARDRDFEVLAEISPLRLL
jgi:predicted nucleic acid-binding protein